MRRVFLGLVGFVAIAGTAGFVLWQPTGGNASDAAYRLAAVDRGPLTASVRATGTLNPVTTVLVGSQLSGQVVEILADYNTPVKEGQVVARLNSEQIKSRLDAAQAELAQARADRETRSAQIAKARSAIERSAAQAEDLAAQRDRAQAQLEEAQRNLERQTQLSARAVGTQAALEQAQTQVEIQKASLASATAQIASNKAELEGLKADLALAESGVKSADAVILQRQAKLRDLEIDLTRTNIKSPVDGVVVKRDIELGQTVAASLSAPTLFTIAQDLSEIHIHANIDEADVGRLKPDQRVSFTVNAYPNRTFEGTVRMVRLGAETVQNVVTYTAVIAVKNKDLALLPGMTANLQVITDEREDAQRIPNAALRFRPATLVAGAPRGEAQDGQASRRPVRGSKAARPAAEEGTEGRVYRLGADGAPELVRLRLGVTDGSHTEVLQGDLDEGTAVIVGGPRASGSGDESGPAARSRPRPPRLF
ncbi:efflux RND transporter periplasmic adaptor subunit [Microvirga roseola]|uniref:efflux RND transporter periplasmic adaptor subunit n=1 Tax=Microvirga roseola TaxID=2883126 RepID=UPI001E495CEF|nr:efflux RND transporter periplasmic adaptor subunit [Microvirga roseola]